MTDPDIKARFTPHILDIRQALARLEDERKSSNNPGMGAEQAVEEQDFRIEPIGAGERIFEVPPGAQPPAPADDLHQQVANAIHYVMYGPGGDDITRKLATTAAHAALSVRDLEVEELRRNLATSRKRTEHFARLYSDALDELEDVAPVAESAPGSYWERAVLERFIVGGHVDMKTVRQQVAALLGEIRPKTPEGTEETDQ